MKTFTFYYLFRYLCTKKKIAIINTDHYQCPTCVSAFVEILQSLQCKIFQYTFLGQYPMKFQDFFSLCQIRQPAWLQLDHRKLGPSEMRLLPDPCIIKQKKEKKTLSCVICCFEKLF